MATAPARPLVAVDANVVMDLGRESESVLDALATIRHRLRFSQIVLPPTTKLELIHIARHGDSAEERELASRGIAAARRWRIIPVNLLPVGHGIVELVAEKLRSVELLPVCEVNDSQLVAESALLGARLCRPRPAAARRVADGANPPRGCCGWASTQPRSGGIGALHF